MEYIAVVWFVAITWYNFRRFSRKQGRTALDRARWTSQEDMTRAMQYLSKGVHTHKHDLED